MILNGTRGFKVSLDIYVSLSHLFEIYTPCAALSELYVALYLRVVYPHTLVSLFSSSRVVRNLFCKKEETLSVHKPKKLTLAR